MKKESINKRQLSSRLVSRLQLLKHLQRSASICFITATGFSLATKDYSLSPLVAILLLVITILGFFETYSKNEEVGTNILACSYICLSATGLFALNVLDIAITQGLLPDRFLFLFPIYSNASINSTRLSLMFLTLTCIGCEIYLESVSKRSMIKGEK